MEENQKISFIIVNYQSDKYLEKCIASIFACAGNFQKEIILVNINNDSDIFNNIQNVFSNYDRNLRTHFKTIYVLENKGYGSTCNLGAKEADGDILCFFNPDTEIISGNLEGIIKLFDDDKIGIIGPKLIDENRKIQEWSAGVETGLWDIVKNNLGFKASRKIWESKKIIETDWVSGTCLFIKKYLFEKLNGFDEKFFMYFEDADLCKRARKLGYKIIYSPEFVVRHLGGKSFENKKEQKKLYYSSQDYYFLKHFGKLAASLLKLTRFTAIIK